MEIAKPKFKSARITCMCGEKVIVTAKEQEEAYRVAVAMLARRVKDKCRGKTKLER